MSLMGHTAIARAVEEQQLKEWWRMAIKSQKFRGW
jgi:hypothetical protein